jgi:hypothetical protein
MWLIDEEQMEGQRILHGRNGKEYALPELPELQVDGFYEETRTVYGFMDCYWHGHDCLPFRDVTTVCGGDTCGEWSSKDERRAERRPHGSHVSTTGRRKVKRLYSTLTS